MPLRITFINVGYGDAILLEAANGYVALLDGGSALPSEFEGYPYRIRGDAYLKARGITHLDSVWISHIHEDHVCGLGPILQSVSVDRLFVPYPTGPFLEGHGLKADKDAPRSVALYTDALNTYRRLVLDALQGNVLISVARPGDVFELARDLSVRVLAPMPSAIEQYMDTVQAAYAAEEPTALLTKLDATSNQTSLLLSIESEGTVFLTAADNCPSGWEEVPLLFLKNANVLKLPHHGQIDSIDEHLMKEMPLEYVVTTSSSDRRYNSSNPRVYKRLSALFPAGRQPSFLFTDEREYPPYFSQPDGFQAISLVIRSGKIAPGFIKI